MFGLSFLRAVVRVLTVVRVVFLKLGTVCRIVDCAGVWRKVFRCCSLVCTFRLECYISDNVDNCAYVYGDHYIYTYIRMYIYVYMSLTRLISPQQFYINPG